MQHNGEVHLVPVYDPRIRNHGLDFCGIALCSQLNGDGNTFSGETWRLLCSGSYMDYLLKNGVDQDTQKRIYQTLLNPSKTMLPYPELTIMHGLKKKHVLRDSIISKINLCLKQQIHQMSHFQKIIGVAAGGSFAKFSIMSEKNISGHEMNPADASFYQMSLAKLQNLAAIGHYKAARILEYRRKVEENQQNSTETIASYLFRSTITEHCPLSLYGSGVFASGGAIASYCISHDLPSYQIKLLPLDLYTIGRNKQGDKIEKWECLVDDQTIKAGSVYKQPYPINGLVIPEGKEHLELTLRRPDSEGKFMYRSVMAKINKKTDCKEPVEITTDVRPGQGFAKVWINSQRQGVFSTQLDWRTMRAVKKPELLLEYIPNIAFIVSHEEYWTVAKYAIRRFLAADTDDTQDPIGIYKDVLYSMNKFRWEKNSNNIYRHIGPINNDGVSSGLLDASVLKKFQTALVNKWKQSSEGSIKNRLLRIGGWLYLFIPKEMQENVIMNLKMGTEKNFHLHVAGLTFHKEKHFSEFYKAFCKKTDPNAEWFRSLRNIVRFRDNALSDEILEEAQLSRILEYVIHNLRYYSPYNQRNKYNNCIEVLIYLLKRRRYDENFLAPESQNTLELKDLLQNIAQKHPTVKYRKIAEQTLVFLNKEATSENLAAILESTEDEDSDED
ncbi:MAG: hypothetical protein J6W00_14300 [Lentisphaeria bacterium]|nr:hypothetical protein [Lentisphaeria bacterium]